MLSKEQQCRRLAGNEAVKVVCSFLLYAALTLLQLTIILRLCVSYPDSTGKTLCLMMDS